MEHIKLSKFFIMIVLSFCVMFVLMYMMVDTFGNIYINLDQVYMVLAMTSAMVLIEIAVMGSMYENKTKIITMIISIFFLVVSFIFIRNQTGISDKEFLKSMISHHGAAILMCNKANLQDTEIQQLCKDIISSQQSQIDWMKTKLQSLN